MSWLTDRLPGRTWSETAFINLSHLFIPVVKAGTVLQIFIKNEPDLTYFSTMVALDRRVEKKHIRFHDDQKGVDDSGRKSEIIMNG